MEKNYLKMEATSRRSKITTKKQFELLVTLLEKYPYAAKGFKYAGDSATFNSIWEDITSKLNGQGPPSREQSGWQKVWNDFKLKLKKKCAYNREVNLKNKKFKLKHLTGLKPVKGIEERVIKMLSLDKVNGEIENFEISYLDNSNSCTSNSFELDSQSFSDDTYITNLTSNVSLVKEIPEFTPNNQKRKERNVNLVQETPDVTQKKQIPTTKLKKNLDAKKNLTDDEVNEIDNLALEIKNHLRKIIKLKKDKIKILKEREERDKAEFKLKLQILLLEKAKLKKELGILKMEDL